MRNPDRIDPVIEELRAFWKRHPDWRLGQVVVNATWGTDPFFVEETALVEGLRRMENPDSA